MNIWDIIQNPVMIGLFAGVLTYIYMKWRKNKDYKKNKKLNKKKKDINLLIPFAVFIVFWFISYAYLSSCDNETIETTPHIDTKELISRDLMAENPFPSKFKGHTTDGSDVSSVNLVSTGIQIPHQLPDTLFAMR